MSTSSVILRTLVFASGLSFWVAAPSFAQSLREQTRPRTLTSSSEEKPEEITPPIGSPEAKAEAKKVYKAGVEYGNAGLFAQAAELFRRAIKLRPDYSDAYRSLGRAYMDLKDWDNAIKSLERALELDTKDKEARRLLDQTRLQVEANRDEPLKPAGSKTAHTTSPTATTVSATEASLTKVYRVGPGDVLEVHLTPALPTESIAYTVNASGLLEHPRLTEPLPVVGLTVDEISGLIEKGLTPSNPNLKVSVGVQDYVSHAIIVSGLVKEPGTKILRREAIPLSVVVADAQPLPEAERALIVRNETKETFAIDLTQAEELTLLIRPGDVINLQPQPSQFFYVSGEVKAPGEKVFRRGLTLTQAIITAGGLAGDPKEARIARDDGNGFLGVTRFRLKDIELGKLQDPLIQPGDRITIVK